MKTWLILQVQARRVVTSLARVLAATPLVSGTTIGSEPEPVTVDQAMQVAGLRDHFRCEHAAEMTASVA